MTSWLISVFFLPYITVPLYFLVGIRKREKRQQKEYVSFDKAIQKSPYIVDEHHNPIAGILKCNGISPAHAETVIGSLPPIQKRMREYFMR